MTDDSRSRAGGLLDLLVDTLNDRAVEYCHWKSNWALSEALTGEGDLDLFVDRVSLPAALGTLAELGFRPTSEGRASTTPGTSHHYGMDPESGTLLHVHLYTMILSGESYVKSHRFPFETMLLENRSSIGRLRVTSKPAELVLHVLRTFTKYGAVPDILRLRRKPEIVAQELRWLRAGCDLSESLAVLRKHCPVVEEALFLRCVEALEDRTGLAQRILLARKIRRRLRIYARHTPLQRLRAYARFFGARLLGRLSGTMRARTLQSGGAVVAFVGGDATGKSTIVRETGRWLGRAFAVRTAHAGKPPTSWLTWPVKLAAVSVGALRSRRRPKHGGDAQSSNRGSAARPSLAYALRAATLAWDRRRLLIRARRASARGEIVICDRYPSDAVGAMDSPRLAEVPNGSGTLASLHNWLARVERRLYSQIPPPDLAIRLRVSLETAKQRNLNREKPEKHVDGYLESRHNQTGTWNRPGTRHVLDVDTEGSLADTMLRVKNAIWNAL